jgi:hypothetical protein
VKIVCRLRLALIEEERRQEHLNDAEILAISCQHLVTVERIQRLKSMEKKKWDLILNEFTKRGNQSVRKRRLKTVVGFSVVGAVVAFGLYKYLTHK